MKLPKACWAAALTWIFGRRRRVDAVVSSGELVAVLHRKPDFEVWEPAAQGVIAKATVLKDDILGEVGVSITPQHPAFLSGSATASLTDPRWIAGVGLQSTVKASIKATAAIHYHVSSGPFGGDNGGDTTTEGSTTGTLPVTLKIVLERTDVDDAIVLLPEIGCRRIRIDAYSQAALVNFGWIKIGKLGVRITRSVGGGRQTPTPLVTSLPQIYAIRSENAPGAVEELHLAHPALAASWNLKSAEVEETGIRIVAGLSIASSDAKPSAVSKEAQTHLREALASAAPTTTCGGGQELALLVDQADIGSSNEIVKLVDKTVKAGVRVTQQTMDQVEKLRTKPLETIGKAPPTSPRRPRRRGNGWEIERAYTSEPSMALATSMSIRPESAEAMLRNTFPALLRMSSLLPASSKPTTGASRAGGNGLAIGKPAMGHRHRGRATRPQRIVQLAAQR